MKRLESINLNAAKRALRARDAARDLDQLKLRGGPAEEVQDAEQMLRLLKREAEEAEEAAGVQEKEGQVFEETVVRWEGQVTQPHLKEVEADLEGCCDVCCNVCDEQTEWCATEGPCG